MATGGGYYKIWSNLASRVGEFYFYILHTFSNILAEQTLARHIKGC
jgi:hypothetical protein